MAFAILSHPVADFKTWKAFYDADADRRAASGLKEIFVGQDSEDPGMAYMVFKMEYAEAVRKLVSDPKLAEVMKEAGVTGPPKVVIIE